MMNNNYQHLLGINSLGMGFGLGIGIFFLALIVWTLFWKGLALWHSARHNKPYWFVALLVLNTLGILEIIFLFGVLKLKIDDLFSSKK